VRLRSSWNDRLRTEHALRDPRIKVLVFPKAERWEAHLHNALMAASGRYIAHIEDDDLWFPTHLEELEKLLQIADFGHLMHVWAKPDESIKMLESDLRIPEFRQRMLDEKYNRFGFSVCGYRRDAYRRLPEGWAPRQNGFELLGRRRARQADAQTSAGRPSSRRRLA
jgi:hypothetical protein